MLPEHICLVMEMKLDGRLSPFGKHEAHPPHDWWYTSSGGGHQMYAGWEPDHKDWDTYQGSAKQWHCPGRSD